jgi:hypothetical protein
MSKSKNERINKQQLDIYSLLDQLIVDQDNYEIDVENHKTNMR